MKKAYAYVASLSLMRKKYMLEGLAKEKFTSLFVLVVSDKKE